VLPVGVRRCLVLTVSLLLAHLLHAVSAGTCCKICQAHVHVGTLPPRLQRGAGTPHHAALAGGGVCTHAGVLHTVRKEAAVQKELAQRSGQETADELTLQLVKLSDTALMLVRALAFFRWPLIKPAAGISGMGRPCLSLYSRIDSNTCSLAGTRLVQYRPFVLVACFKA